LTGGSPTSSTLPVGATVYNTPGTYTISLGVTNPCGTSNATQTVTINPLPVSAIVSTSSVCAGDLVSANGTSSTNATGYSWSFPGGSPSVGSFVSSGTSYATAGTYTMTLDASNACGTNSSTFTVTVNACLGVNGIASSDLKIYYNNLNQQSVIEFPDAATEGNYKVAMYNEIGQVLYQSNVEVSGSQRQFFINANNLAQGIYFVQLSGNGMNVVKKFVR
jgi:PKD repeat protein